MQQWASFIIASASHSEGIAAATEVAAKPKSITLLLITPFPEHSRCQNFVPVRSLLWILLPMPVQLLPWLMCIFSWHLQQMTPCLTATWSRVLWSPLKIPLPVCIMISLVFTWPSGNFGFHGCGSHSQQRHLLLGSLMCSHIKTWMPVCSASLSLPGKQL